MARALTQWPELASGHRDRPSWAGFRLWLAGRRPDLVCWSDGTDAINASETDCVAGHIGLELPNPRTNYLFEVPCKFPLFWVSALENIRV